VDTVEKLNFSEIWKKAQGHIKGEIGERAFEIWLEPLAVKEGQGHKFILEAPDDFFKERVVDNYAGVIQDAILKACGQSLSVEFKVNAALVDKAAKARVEELKSRIIEQPSSLSLNPRYTFEAFVVGPSNRFAHAASLAVAESPAKAYNPLFIYGRVGLGKTHLMQAICHSAKSQSAGAVKISYLPAETFTNELIDAIQHKSMAQFRQKYRNVDILVLDDIHFIAGKESTQEEFFHTFNTLYDAHKQIIISSDRPPKEIARLEERLISRFSWGLVTDIQPPDLETRIAILKKKIEKEPVKVPDDVIHFIAEVVKTNIRELEGALIRVIAYSMLEEKSINLDLAQDILKDLAKEPIKLITVPQIIRQVAEEFGMNTQDFITKKRTKNVVLPRQIAIYLSRELTDLSLPEIGRLFGGKDHTTILYAYNKIKEGATINSKLKEQVRRLTQTIKTL